MTAAPEYLQGIFDEAFAGVGRAREAFTPRLTPREVGTITSVSTGVARVSGPIVTSWTAIGISSGVGG